MSDSQHRHHPDRDHLIAAEILTGERALIVAGDPSHRHVVATLPIPALYPLRHLCTGPCRTCAGSKRTEFGPCLTCCGTGHATVHVDSPICHELRLEIGNMSDAGGASMVRTVPMDTGREHGPIAERATRTDNHRRGWIVASENAGALSWFLTLNRIGGPQAIPSHELRLGWNR